MLSVAVRWLDVDAVQCLLSNNVLDVNVLSIKLMGHAAQRMHLMLITRGELEGGLRVRATREMCVIRTKQTAMGRVLSRMALM